MHARHDEFVGHVKKYVDNVNEDAVAGIIKHLGIAIGNKDAERVSCSEKKELDRIRDGFMKKKLALTDNNADLEAAIQEVCDKMGRSNPHKSRVAFYYLLAEKYGMLDKFA